MLRDEVLWDVEVAHCSTEVRDRLEFSVRFNVGIMKTSTDFFNALQVLMDGGKTQVQNIVLVLLVVLDRSGKFFVVHLACLLVHFGVFEDSLEVPELSLEGLKRART